VSAAADGGGGTNVVSTTSAGFLPVPSIVRLAMVANSRLSRSSGLGPWPVSTLDESCTGGLAGFLRATSCAWNDACAVVTHSLVPVPFGTGALSSTQLPCNVRLPSNGRVSAIACVCFISGANLAWENF
jgi:hypothetical protein